jgi:hypothetical protein
MEDEEYALQASRRGVTQWDREPNIGDVVPILGVSGEKWRRPPDATASAIASGDSPDPWHRPICYRAVPGIANW